MAISDEPFAGNYQHHGTTLTCNLFEGSITVSNASSNLYSPAGVIAYPILTWGTECKKGDFVKLNVYAANEMSATGGVPTVELADADGDFVIGRIVSVPKLVGPSRPTAAVTINSTGTWATAMSNGYFRQASVELYFSGVFIAVATGATAGPIVPGNVVQPSAAEIANDGWVVGTDVTSGYGLVQTAGGKYGGTEGNCLDQHFATFIALTAANADDEYILVGYGDSPCLMVA